MTTPNHLSWAKILSDIAQIEMGGADVCGNFDVVASLKLGWSRHYHLIDVQPYTDRSGMALPCCLTDYVAISAKNFARKIDHTPEIEKLQPEGITIKDTFVVIHASFKVPVDRG